jgi:hypothetical protein
MIQIEGLLCSCKRGTGNSGLITIDKPEQAILERNSIILTKDYIELHFFIGLPAEGRDIKGDLALSMIFKEMPSIVEQHFTRTI